MAVYVDVAERYVKTEAVFGRVKLQILTGSLLLAALGFRVWVKIGTYDLGYKLAALRAEAVELDMQRRELDMQLSVLTRPDRLSALAKERFGLKVPRPDQVVKIGS